MKILSMLLLSSLLVSGAAFAEPQGTSPDAGISPVTNAPYGVDPETGKKWGPSHQWTGPGSAPGLSPHQVKCPDGTWSTAVGACYSSEGQGQGQADNQDPLPSTDQNLNEAMHQTTDQMVRQNSRVSEECLEVMNRMIDICNRNVHTQECFDASQRKRQICDGVIPLPAQREGSATPTHAGVPMEFLGQPAPQSTRYEGAAMMPGTDRGQYLENMVKQYESQGSTLQQIHDSWKKAYDETLETCGDEVCDEALSLQSDLKWLEGYIRSRGAAPN